jgi:hypothetical protein
MVYRDISTDIKRLIVRNCALFPEDFVAIILDVSVATIRRTLDIYEEFGDVVTPNDQKLQRGRPAILNEEDREVWITPAQFSVLTLYRQFIEGILEEQNDRYLDELRDFVFERRGKKASVATLSRALASMGMTHKKVMHI